MFFLYKKVGDSNKLTLNPNQAHKIVINTSNKSPDKISLVTLGKKNIELILNASLLDPNFTKFQTYFYFFKDKQNSCTFFATNGTFLRRA